MKAGRVIGGGGTINTGIFYRAHKGDFDRWVSVNMIRLFLF